MEKNYLNWLNSHQFYGIKPGLKRIKEILKRLGNPHRYIKTIHIAGTNGKGSTASILSEILLEHGFKVGLYTSPHLIQLNERFKINGKKIENERLNEYLKYIKKNIKDYPATYFEITTALAFLYFYEEKVDIGVIECGMGGRLDATNIINPEVSIITSIGWDHTKYLGNTLEKIAHEKAGIIKRETPCVLGDLSENLIPIFQKKAEILKAPLFIVGKDFYIEFNKKNNWNYVGDHKFEDLNLNLKGYYQGNNLSCALKALEILERKEFLKITEEKLRKALGQVKVSGRYEFLNIKGKTILIDTAHNLDGFIALKSSLLKDNFKDFLLILGITNEEGDKPFVKMIEILLPLAKKIYLCEFNSPRKIVSIREWKKSLEKFPTILNKIEFVENCERAVKMGLESDFEKILVTGSIYFVGEYLKNLKFEKI
ncbi:MAG: bifunctional folylpolyglutamate synthase/dihydrofolate synthase [Thermodesulfobacterium geofontis]|uniref:Dihydrofolate synthase/folylpolyglutamate synthase n=2 Tax=Thermodesulfobacterium geofontis TaxID=1295609 RepID=A0A2N7QGK0_9BACT|nr:MAG: bifunctional folylpolyglutamate synthase/dihydrofolate synthase [Thermodesulfobacterium geofontis]